MIVTSDGQVTPQTPSDHIQLALVACREKQSDALGANNREMMELLLSHEERLLELLVRSKPASAAPIFLPNHFSSAEEVEKGIRRAITSAAWEMTKNLNAGRLVFSIKEVEKP